MTVSWAYRRAGVMAGLEVLAVASLDAAVETDRAWPSLTDAVHWVVDDTFWDIADPRAAVGEILVNEEEAEALAAVVSEVCGVSERQGASATDREWLKDDAWPRVRALAGLALAMSRSNSL